MEQLSHAAVRQLLARARSDAAERGRAQDGSTGFHAPGQPKARDWVNPAVEAEPALSLGAFPAFAEPSGVERRLVRRAEALWTRLAGEALLPPASAAGELLRPPFAAQGLLLETPTGGSARLSFVGDSLASLSGLSQGLAEEGATDNGSASTRLGARLVALARRAATLATPCLYDSDEDRATASPGSADSQLLMRAIALPLSGLRDGSPGATAMVVASWRKLLSAEETRALHRELAAAIDWMHRQGG